MYDKTNIKGIIFDYGGTLDTGGCHWGKVLWHAYQRAGVPVSELQFREAYVYGERQLARNPIITPTDTFRQTLAKKIALQLSFLKVEESFAPTLLDDLYAQVVRQTQYSRSVLLGLKRSWPLVLVSNFYGNMPTVLRELGFDGLFGQVVESAVVGVRKPDPRIFTLGVDALGLAPHEVLVVGDSFDKDILPARQAGCKTAWLKGEGWTSQTFDETLPDKVIADLKEIF